MNLCKLFINSSEFGILPRFIISKTLNSSLLELRSSLLKVPASFQTSKELNGKLTYYIDQTRQEIYQWLAAPDPFLTHAATLKKHQPKTGEWFLTSKQYEEWNAANGSFLWLYGIRTLNDLE